jgi:hypothetical protein
VLSENLPYPVVTKDLSPSIPIGKNLVAVGFVVGEDQSKQDLIVKSEEGEPVRLGSFLAMTNGADGWELETPTIEFLLDDPTIIKNKSSFPNASWLDVPKRMDWGNIPRLTGEEDTDLFLLGTNHDGSLLVGTIGNDDEIVARQVETNAPPQKPT